MKTKIFISLILLNLSFLNAQAQKVDVKALLEIIELQDSAIQLCTRNYDSLLVKYDRLNFLMQTTNAEILTKTETVKTDVKAIESNVQKSQKVAKRKERRKKILWGSVGVVAGVITGLIIQ